MLAFPAPEVFFMVLPDAEDGRISRDKPGMAENADAADELGVTIGESWDSDQHGLGT